MSGDECLIIEQIVTQSIVAAHSVFHLKMSRNATVRKSRQGCNI